jgi:hypothetical protein
MGKLQDKFAQALLANGEVEVIPSKSRKYRTFTRHKGGYYFLGKAGSVRYGQAVSSSLAASDKWKELLLGKH